MLQLIVITFFITFAYDVVLQLARHTPLHTYLQGSDWYVKLVEPGGYFSKHTPLAAALLAGLIGGVTQTVILSFFSLPKTSTQIITFLLATFIISALAGLFINDEYPTSSRLFPHISSTYYTIGKLRSMYTDGLSGLIVQLTLLTLIYFYNTYI